MKRTPLKRAGKRVKEWERIRRKLKVRFEKAGIMTCEFQYGGCWNDNGLGFAHLDKRRFLKPNELYAVALACVNCHDLLEYLHRGLMRKTIQRVIDNRIEQP